MGQDMFGIFRQQAERTPDAPFLELPGHGTLSYAAAYARTGQLANALKARGVGPGDRVAIQAEKSATALLTWLATIRLGAAYLPLNTAYTAAELAFFLADARPALFIHRPEDDESAAALAHECAIPARLALAAGGSGALSAAADAQSPDCPPHPVGPADLAAILYTSGTTGRSKGAMLNHGNLASNARVLADLWEFTARDVLLHALPIFHTHGLFVATNTIIAAGGSMILLPRFDPAELLRWMPRATALMGVPTFYTRLLGEAGFTQAAAAHMRLFVSGSAPLSAETHKAFHARTGHAILERYGMTETNMNTSNPLHGDRIPGSVGLPLPGTELRICDPETGAPLAPGAVGVIEVRGPNVFSGYWQLPEKTRQEFRADGFFITGDLGRIDERGYVWIVGRAKDLIICGGFNVYPAEVEALLDAIPGIAEAAVIGAPHPDMGEGVVAVVRADDPALDEAGVLAQLQGSLARFKQPRRVLFVAELPRNTMGKIQKALLRDRYADIFQAAG